MAATRGTDPTGKGWSGPPLVPAEYELVTCAVLREEIAERNEGRDEAELLSAAGHHAELVERLRADDAEMDAYRESVGWGS